MGDYQFFQMFAYVEVIRIKTLLLEMPGLPAIPIWILLSEVHICHFLNM